MPHEKFSNDLLLPELKLIKQLKNSKNRWRIFLLEKTSPFEVCPKCATKSTSVYDHVIVTIKDEPLRHRNVILKIRKRRFRCPNCKSIFREPVPGIRKGFRTTERFRKHVMWCCQQFMNLKKVAEKCRCSEWFVYKAHYEQLKLETKKFQTPWPKTVGIDEHSFCRGIYGRKDFVTIFVDYNLKKIREVSMGRAPAELLSDNSLLAISGRENVKNVVIDLSPGFRSFARTMFPNAILIADKFHILKLLSGAIIKYQKEIVGRTRKNPFKKMLLKTSHKLKPHERTVLRSILHFYPHLRAIYMAKESIHRIFRTKGLKRVQRSLTSLTDWLATVNVPELQTFRRTLLSWRKEILNYFMVKITNARTEGYNRKAKLIQRNAYGYKKFENYRLRLLTLCR